MKLFKVHIKTYHFGNVYYELFILSDSKENAKQVVYTYPRYHNDDDAEIVGIEEIDLTDTTNRVI